MHEIVLVLDPSCPFTPGESLGLNIRPMLGTSKCGVVFLLLVALVPSMIGLYAWQSRNAGGCQELKQFRTFKGKEPLVPVPSWSSSAGKPLNGATLRSFEGPRLIPDPMHQSQDAHRMELLWITLYEQGHVQLEDVRLLQGWVQELSARGYTFPAQATMPGPREIPLETRTPEHTAQSTEGPGSAPPAHTPSRPLTRATTVSPTTAPTASPTTANPTTAATVSPTTANPTTVPQVGPRLENFKQHMVSEHNAISQAGEVNATVLPITSVPTIAPTTNPFSTGANGDRLEGYTTVTHVEYCKGTNLPTDDFLEAGFDSVGKHCPLIGARSRESALALAKSWCDARVACAGFTDYTNGPASEHTDLNNPAMTGPKRFCFRSSITGLEDDPSSPAKCFIKGKFPTQAPTTAPAPTPAGSEYIRTQHLKGKSLELAKLINNLHHARATRLDTNHWGVPLYVLTLGGQRFEQFKKEMEAEHHPFTVVPQSKKPLQSDYPSTRNKGVLGCTRAHLSFAQELLKRGDKCAVVAEDDASFAMSAHWPESLKDLCDRMFKKDPNWTTLTLYAHNARAPPNGHVDIVRYTEGTWGTVAYMATQRWAKIMTKLSHDNTRLMRSEIGSRYGTADSAVYAFKGSAGYVLHPNYVFPNNVETGSAVEAGHAVGKGRNDLHLRTGIQVVKQSMGHFAKPAVKNHKKGVKTGARRLHRSTS